MNRSLITLLLALAAASPTLAADKCDAGPRAQWQPREALEKKLSAEGWKVRRIKVDKGCYEVYGTDAQGRKAEAYFDPKTFEPVKS